MIIFTIINILYTVFTIATIASIIYLFITECKNRNIPTKGRGPG